MDKKPGKIIKIALTGPESTGKTSLSAELANYYKTLWVPEYAREYLNDLGSSYTEEDLLKIAKGQRKNEKNQLLKANKFLFCDTDMLVIKIWSLHKYGRVNPKIEEWFTEKPHDFYLLCYPDLKWTSDPLRENPEGGDYFFSEFENELIKNNLDYAVVKGNGNNRLQNAIQEIETIYPSL